MQICTLFAHLVLGEGEPVLQLPEEEEHRLRTTAEKLHETENSNSSGVPNVMMMMMTTMMTTMMMMMMMMRQT